MAGFQEDDKEQNSFIEMIRGANSLAMNSYRRTKVPAGFPTEIMTRYLNQAKKYRQWIQRTGFPVRTDNLNAAINALIDSILEFRRTGGIFEPARYQGGADPKSAEHLAQFSQFLNQRMNQKPIPGKQWAPFAQYWEEFIEDLQDGFQKWQSQR